MIEAGKGESSSMYYADSILKKLKESRQVVIFGAGLVAVQAANCLMSRPYQLQIDYCIVSELNENPGYITGIPVIELEEAGRIVQKDVLILIATMEKHLRSIQDILRKYGFFNSVPLTFESDLWSEIQGNYYREHWMMQKEPYLILEEELAGISEHDTKGNSVIRVYTVRSHMDKQAGEDISRYLWETPIQAGAALTKRQICEIKDNTGDNISYKNRQYCELTALYWIWKNDYSDYTGLCHYRRHFELDSKILENLPYSDIDVVLTIPILNFPSVREVYRHDHIERDWDIMLEAVRKLSPEYLAAAIELQNGNYYYGYNMFIARKEILNSYCEWLFPILSYCERSCGVKEDTYQMRYIGFLAERLMSVYFLHHREEYKIAHARKHFIS